MPDPGLSGTGIRVHQSSTGMQRYRTEMLNEEIPMPAPSASMLMPSFGANAEVLIIIVKIFGRPMPILRGRNSSQMAVILPSLGMHTSLFVRVHVINSKEYIFYYFLSKFEGAN
jgi:hypothetical protein